MLPVCQAPWAPKATRDPLEPPVLPECPVMESLGPMVRREREGPLGPLEPQVVRESRVLLVTQVPLVPPEPLAPPDLRGLVASQVRPAL